jgi:hypothetical protein
MTCRQILLGLGLLLGSCNNSTTVDMGSVTDLSTPDLSMPDLSMPDLSVPDLSTPDLTACVCTAPMKCNANGQCVECLTAADCHGGDGGIPMCISGHCM